MAGLFASLSSLVNLFSFSCRGSEMSGLGGSTDSRYRLLKYCVDPFLGFLHFKITYHYKHCIVGSIIGLEEIIYILQLS